MINFPQSNTAQIRRSLNTAFDDPALDAFCQDYFPAVFDRFGRGMRKDEKITLLLDYCRRGVARFESLRQAVNSEYEMNPSQQDELKSLLETINAFLESRQSAHYAASKSLDHTTQHPPRPLITLGALLCRHRLDASFDQKRLSFLLDDTPSTVSQVETGDQVPTQTYITRFVEALHLSETARQEITELYQHTLDTVGDTSRPQSPRLLPEMLRRYRLDASLSQKQLSAILGYPSSLISQIETGAQHPTPDYLEQFIEKLGLSDIDH